MGRLLAFEDYALLFDDSYGDSVSDPHWIRIQLGQRIRIRQVEIGPPKKEKFRNSKYWKVWMFFVGVQEDIQFTLLYDGF